jgi:hypothetical protein
LLAEKTRTLLKLLPGGESPGPDALPARMSWMAQHFAANLTMLHVYAPPANVERGEHEDEALKFQKQRELGAERLRSTLEYVRAKHLHCDTVFEWGEPDDLIVTAARNLDADLIVLSTHDCHRSTHRY